MWNMKLLYLVVIVDSQLAELKKRSQADRLDNLKQEMETVSKTPWTALAEMVIDVCV